MSAARKPRSCSHGVTFSSDDEDMGFESSTHGAGSNTPAPRPAPSTTAKSPPRPSEAKAPAPVPVTAKRRDPRSPTPQIEVASNPAILAPRPTVILPDPRKLTKKDQNTLARWRGENHGKMLDSYFKGQMEAARRKFGHRGVSAGTMADNLLIGIPCPSLAFEYLLCLDCFPLGLILHLNGPPGSLKSALLYEFMRWVRAAGGGSFLEEVETKWSPILLQSLVGFADGEHNVLVDRCHSVEEWQQRIIYNVDQSKRLMMGTKDAPGPGPTFPILFGVDSIVGKESAEIQEKVMERGHGDREFPKAALIITQWMKTFAHQIDDWPFTIVLNNHLKLGTDKQGRETKRTAGGQGVGFQESFELQTRVIKKEITSASWDGVQIRITNAKNSFGTSHRSIDARMLWWNEKDENGVWKQRTVWDWDWATIKLLTTLEGKAKATLKAEDVHVAAVKVSDVDNTAWSATLGMKEKDAVPWQELGKMIRKDEALMNRIRGALGIHRLPFLAGDYVQQLEEQRLLLP